MVSRRTLIHAVALTYNVAIVDANLLDATTPILPRIPVMPRIPSHAKHIEVINARSLSDVDSSAVVKSICLDPTQEIVFHDETAAQLSICGSLAGSIQRCEGSLSVTEGKYGTAAFAVSAVDEFSVINISKAQWIKCVHAARASCPTGSLSAVCAGGGTKGDVAFTLMNPQRANTNP